MKLPVIVFTLVKTKGQYTRFDFGVCHWHWTCHCTISHVETKGLWWFEPQIFLIEGR